MIWDLVQRLGGQLRILAGFGGVSVIGWDMAAVWPLADALGLDRWLVGQVLPEIEAAAVAAMNERAADG